MNASRTLTSLVAAAAIVGSVGFAYAQTAAPAEPVTTPNTEVTPTPMAPAQDTLSAPATSAAPADSGMASEPAPKADRN